MSIEELAKEFILDCKVRNLSPRTVRNYEKQLVYFKRFLKEAQGVENLEELKPIHIKQFVAMLQEKKNKTIYSVLSASVPVAQDVEEGAA